MKLTLGQSVITPRGKTGRVVAVGLPDGAVRAALDPFVPDWAGQGRGQKLSQKRRRWLGVAQPRQLVGVEVVYRAKELQPAEGKRIKAKGKGGSRYVSSHATHAVKLRLFRSYCRCRVAD